MGCASSLATTTEQDTSALVEILGAELLTASGTVATDVALAGKSAVCIYFSAHWCPPCRQFTPVLSKTYTDVLKAKGVEVVFVSSDRDESSFRSYYKDMPWLALPFGDRALNAKLSSTYHVSGIPTLVLLDASGKLISTDGRSKVMSDPTGKWVPVQPAQPSAAVAKADVAPPPMVPMAGGLGAVLGSEALLDSDGKTPITLAAMAKDAPLVAIYFSAHWCGPCRQFTPKLQAFVEALDKEGVRLPIVFGSSDRDAAAFSEYFSTMPWFAFPYGDKRIDALKRKFEVSGIPWLVVLDVEGNLVANEADVDVAMGTAAYQKWLKLSKKEVVAAPTA